MHFSCIRRQGREESDWRQGAGVTEMPGARGVSGAWAVPGANGASARSTG